MNIVEGVGSVFRAVFGDGSGLGSGLGWDRDRECSGLRV